MIPRSILVTDGEQRATLAIVRSLGAAGHRVFATSVHGHSLAGASRYCRAEAKVSDASTNPSAFLADLATLLRAWEIEVLIPVTDVSLLTVLSERARFGAVCIPFPDLDTFRRVSDKRLVLETAATFGLRVPNQWSVFSRDATVTFPAGALSYPLVLKPSRSVPENGAARRKLAARYVADAAHLEAQLATFDDSAFPILVQQRLRGPGVGVFLMVWEGRTLAVFSHRRIREKPPWGGVSVYAESIAADPDLVRRSEALLAHFGWEGVAMVEYKLDAPGGTPYLMEINGRFWGSLQLAVDAGVDFPGLLVAAAMGENPPAVTRYRVGVRCRWWWGEVDHLLARLRRPNDGVDSSFDAQSRWRAVGNFLTVWRRGDHNEILRLRDPRPFVRETIEWLRAR